MKYAGLYNFYYNELIEEINLLAKDSWRVCSGISVVAVTDPQLDTNYRYHVLMERKI